MLLLAALKAAPRLIVMVVDVDIVFLKPISLRSVLQHSAIEMGCENPFDRAYANTGFLIAYEGSEVLVSAWTRFSKFPPIADDQQAFRLRVSCLE